MDRISPYSSPDMGWEEGWGAPLELALARARAQWIDVLRRPRSAGVEAIKGKLGGGVTVAGLVNAREQLVVGVIILRQLSPLGTRESLASFEKLHHHA